MATDWQNCQLTLPLPWRAPFPPRARPPRRRARSQARRPRQLQFKWPKQVTAARSAMVRPGMRLADAIITLRLTIGASQPQLAKMAGLAERRLRAIERGKRPTLAELERVADILGVDVECLAELRLGRTIKATRVRRARVETTKLIPPGAPGSSTWDELPYDVDPYARSWCWAIARYGGGDGATVDQVAEIIGISPRAVQRAEASALAKLRTELLD